MIKKHGLSLVEIMIILTVVGILLLISLPNFTSTAGRVRRDTCINNLRRINLAKEQWALENNIEVGEAGSTPDAGDLDPYIDGGTAELVCPLDASASFATSYDIKAFGFDPACKISPGDHHL